MKAIFLRKPLFDILRCFLAICFGIYCIKGLQFFFHCVKNYKMLLLYLWTVLTVERNNKKLSEVLLLVWKPLWVIPHGQMKLAIKIKPLVKTRPGSECVQCCHGLFWCGPNQNDLQHSQEDCVCQVFKKSLDLASRHLTHPWVCFCWGTPSLCSSLVKGSGIFQHHLVFMHSI